MESAKPTPATVAETMKHFAEAAEEAGQEMEKVVRKPYVPKPHLTDRPFKNNAGLRELQKKLGPVKSAPRRANVHHNNNKEKK